MYYLARNKEVVAEARQLFHPERGKKVGNTSGSGVSFTTLGSFPSRVLKREVFIGVKEYKNPRPGYNEWRLKHRAPLELATITAIAEHIPELRDNLPMFYALLRGAKRKRVGILMEDFSEGGRLPVDSLNSIPEGLISLFGADVLEEDFVDHMGFYVEGRSRYGDFYPFFNTFKNEEALARHPMSQAMRQVTRNMWQHTIRLGRDL